MLQHFLAKCNHVATMKDECMVSHAGVKKTPACTFQSCTADQSSVSVLSAHEKARICLTRSSPQTTMQRDS